VSIFFPEARRISRTPEYIAWRNMGRRCRCPYDRSYRNYGGRGIKVCARWNIFENFLADMGPRPGAEYSMDRINNDGNYDDANRAGC
jgi:hypothetical protein